jgi:phage gpG-like protein
MTTERFDPRRVRVALTQRARSFRDELEARIRLKVTGGVLQTHSGALAASIRSSIDDDESDTTITASSAGVPYAAIQELGGKTAAHEIIATNAKALAFGARGGLVFAKKVNDPGSIIPPRSYLASSLSELRDEIESGLKSAILEALRAT